MFTNVTTSYLLTGPHLLVFVRANECVLSVFLLLTDKLTIDLTCGKVKLIVVRVYKSLLQLSLPVSIFYVRLALSLPDLNRRGAMEQTGSASDTHTMEGSEVDSVLEELRPVNQLHDSTTKVREEEKNPHNSADEAEKANNEPQPVSELIKSAAHFQTDTTTKSDAETSSQEHLERNELDTATDCDSSTVSTEGGISPISNETDESSEVPVASLDDLVESSPSVLEGTIENLLTFDEAKDSNATTPDIQEQPLVLLTNCPTASSPANDNGSAEIPSSSVQSTCKHSPTDSTTTSGISNGPSTPSSDTVSSSLASSPQTSGKTSGPSHSLSSPYDTDCSRKLISQIQRSLSQESLLDEIESELLACQLPEGKSGSERKGSPTVNGLAADGDGCMVVFEKCVQYKYAQQEKAIQR